MGVHKLHVFAFLAVLSIGFCNACSNPQITSKSFTTQDATIVTNIAYISEFSVKCSSGLLSHMYADVEGIVIPVAEIAPNRYQVSWTEEIKTARRGDITLRMFDEDGYTALRKVVRSGEDTASVTPLFNVVLHHPGAFTGPWLKSEFLAAALAFVVAYLALSSRAKLLS